MNFEKLEQLTMTGSVGHRYARAVREDYEAASPTQRRKMLGLPWHASDDDLATAFAAWTAPETVGGMMDLTETTTPKDAIEVISHWRAQAKRVAEMRAEIEQIRAEMAQTKETNETG